MPKRKSDSLTEQLDSVKRVASEEQTDSELEEAKTPIITTVDPGYLAPDPPPLFAVDEATPAVLTQPAERKAVAVATNTDFSAALASVTSPVWSLSGQRVTKAATRPLDGDTPPVAVTHYGH